MALESVRFLLPPQDLRGTGYAVFEDIKGRLFPVIGLSDKIQLRTNFGSDPTQLFKWDEANHKVIGIKNVSDEKIVEGIEASL